MFAVSIHDHYHDNDHDNEEDTHHDQEHKLNFTVVTVPRRLFWFLFFGQDFTEKLFQTGRTAELTKFKSTEWRASTGFESPARLG